MPYFRNKSYISWLFTCLFVGTGADVRSAEPSILMGPETRVFDLAYSSDGRRLAVAYEDGSFRIWDLASRHAIVIQKYAHDNHCRSIAWGLDSEIVWTIGDEGTVKSWSSRTGQPSATAIQIEKPYCIIVCPSPERLAIASRDSEIYLLPVDPIQATIQPPRQTLKGHEGPVRNLAVSNDGLRLASVGHDHILKVWDLQALTCLQTSPGTGNGRLFAVAFSNSGNLIAFAGDGGRIHVFDQEANKLQLNWKGHEREIRSLAFSRDSKWLASVGEDIEARVWNVTDGKLLQSLAGHKSKAYSVEFSPIESTLAVGRSDGCVEIWQNLPSP